jgi:hypothetical protein
MPELPAHPWFGRPRGLRPKRGRGDRTGQFLSTSLLRKSRVALNGRHSQKAKAQLSRGAPGDEAKDGEERLLKLQLHVFYSRGMGGIGANASERRSDVTPKRLVVLRPSCRARAWKSVPLARRTTPQGARSAASCSTPSVPRPVARAGRARRKRHQSPAPSLGAIKKSTFFLTNLSVVHYMFST